MHVLHGIESYTESRPVVASIGNYDGVHLGHQTILERVVEEAERRDAPSLLITFRPHPISVVAPSRGLHLLQTNDQQLASLAQAGLDNVLLVEFTLELAKLDGEQFFCDFLMNTISFAAIHVGPDFRFGHMRQGDHQLLKRLGSQHGFEVHGVPAVLVDGQTVSSSTIRKLVLEGDVARAALLLGRPFELTGIVIRGDDRGRTLSFPTANLAVENEITPATGVYVTQTTSSSGHHQSITNVGYRPTFERDGLSIETHLLDFEGDLYDSRIGVRFLQRIRDEIRFSSTGELTTQIASDRTFAEAYFKDRSCQEHCG
jgi:riboflavin kinase/FMN adenylyltransferase